MVLGLKEYLVECAKLCIKSEVILLYVNRIMKKVRYLWTSHGTKYAIRAFNILAWDLLMAGSVELQPKQNNNQVKLQITYFNNIIIFLLERGHNDSFLVFTFVGFQLMLIICPIGWKELIPEANFEPCTKVHKSWFHTLNLSLMRSIL